MRIKFFLLIINLIINFSSFNIIFAVGYSNVTIIGFSKNGKYLAYETTFFDDMVGEGYKRIYYVDVIKNKFIKIIEVLDNNKVVQKSDESINEHINREFTKYKIIKDNIGNLVYKDKTFIDQLNYQKQNASQYIVRNVKFNYRLKEARSYELVLKEYQPEKADCPLLKEQSINPKIFKLIIKDQKSSKVLQKDKILYKSRYCPYAYGIHQIYIYNNKIVIFIDSWTAGNEGPNIHKLVTTGTLP